jgi:hypothetical protein
MHHQYYYLDVSIKVYDRVSLLQCLESSPWELGVWSQFCELIMILNGGKVTQAMGAEHRQWSVPHTVTSGVMTIASSGVRHHEMRESRTTKWAVLWYCHLCYFPAIWYQPDTYVFLVLQMIAVDHWTHQIINHLTHWDIVDGFVTWFERIRPILTVLCWGLWWAISLALTVLWELDLNRIKVRLFWRENF